MRPAFICLVLIVLLSATAGAQQPAPGSEEAAVLAVVDRFMTAISTNDSEGLAKLRLEGSVNLIARPGTAGSMLVSRRPFVPGQLKPGYRERYWDPVVHVRGSIAVVWTPYEFWQDGKTTHCGVDVFDMVKQDGAWRIANMMWTVEPDACPELRPTDPAKIRPRP
jgi:hypothetical protein